MCVQKSRKISLLLPRVKRRERKTGEIKSNKVENEHWRHQKDPQHVRKIKVEWTRIAASQAKHHTCELKQPGLEYVEKRKTFFFARRKT